MKKYLLFFCSLTGFLFSSAQNSWGLVSSLGFDHIKGGGMSNRFTAGYNAGAYAQIQIVKRLSLQPQFLFSQKNISVSTDFKDIYPESASSNFKTAVSLDYISIPLLFNYRINNLWSLNLGSQYSYLLDSDEKLLNENKSAFKDQDVSVIGGLELKIASLKLYGQYNYGLYNLNAINSDVRQWYSRGFELGIGWRIAR